MNLMLNVIEAMKETDGVLTVKSQPQDRGILILVIDTGVGFPPKRQTRFSTHSLPPSHTAAAWAWRSAARSSNRTWSHLGRAERRAWREFALHITNRNRYRGGPRGGSVIPRPQERAKGDRGKTSP